MNTQYNNQVLLLSKNDAQKFMDIMQNPPKPSSALVALMKGDRPCLANLAIAFMFPITGRNLLNVALKIGDRHPFLPQ